ncbi:hypothetical protein CN495_07520 [Bacillus thuringiensis]|uniref:Uncharacterized protein n=1 Tax=Bacillus thuringiensis TaxID=1428 RepID=A0ABD6SGE7_BACTU|nr:hypothetical protein [Bacillus thuringiensis]PER55594.1 hypothetical protein CN495_07520 [Bacillus thuringiensis]
MCHIRDGIQIERKLVGEMLLETEEQLLARTYGEIEFLHGHLNHMGFSWAIPEVSDKVFMRRLGIPLRNVVEMRKDPQYMEKKIAWLEAVMEDYSHKKFLEELNHTMFIVLAHNDVVNRMLEQGFTSRQICASLGVMFPSSRMGKVNDLAGKLVRHGEEKARKAGWLLYAIRRGMTIKGMVKECPEDFRDIKECHKLLIGAGLTTARIKDLEAYGRKLKKAEKQLQHAS